MNKSEIIERTSELSGLSKADTKRAIEAGMKAINNALSKGEPVVIRNVCSFTTTRRAARTGRNPQTGKEIRIATKNVVRFRANCPGPH